MGKIAEDEANGNDSPVGIPPQRAKPAGVKPDPKARPFTPGMGLSIDIVHQLRLAEDWLLYIATYTSASTNAQTAVEASASPHVRVMISGCLASWYQLACC